MTKRVSPSTSLSLFKTAIDTGVSSSVLLLSATATGASFIGLTVTLTVTSLPSNTPSLTLYLKVSVPEKSFFGVYSMLLPLITAIPLLGVVTLPTFTLRVSPSTSLSLVSTGIETITSSLVVEASSTATGASLTLTTVTVTGTLFPSETPSLTVYSKLSVPK